ncbi:MAG: hypothetical protein HY514_03685 [Candidatus Aenigmarchaeota archaeon]|nr:hypothetical protein [Candidatus Aenigmarchaeota archaeon]
MLHAQDFERTFTEEQRTGLIQDYNSADKAWGAYLNFCRYMEGKGYTDQDQDLVKTLFFACTTFHKLIPLRPETDGN